METFLAVVAALSLVSLALTVGIQACAHWRLRRRHLKRAAMPPVSILKPLRGLDDRLFENLCSFARQDYPHFEIVLGAADAGDPALEVARRLQREFPDVEIRVIVASHRIGMNPKVNNLVNLAAAARHPHVLISDSNVAAGRGYLRAITAELAEPGVGLVANVLAGVGERSLGSELENLHLNTWVAGAVCAADLLGRPVVVGKSMLFRIEDLERVGGFWAVRDVLAEDFVLGRRFHQAGMKVRLSHHVLDTVNVRWTVGQFWGRHLRWAQLRRRLGLPTYLAELLVNPTPLLLLLLALRPTNAAIAGVPAPAWAGAAALALAGKIALDAMLVRRVRGRFPSPVAILAVPFKDLMVATIWLVALVRRTVVWRGNRVWIGAGTVVQAMPQRRRLEPDRGLQELANP
jgi:ceramide glucosyltransferase